MKINISDIDYEKIIIPKTKKDLTNLNNYKTYLKNIIISSYTNFQEYKEKIEELVDENYGNIFCKNLELSYVQRCINNSNYLIIISNKEDYLDILGFAGISLHENKIEIEIICTNQFYKEIGTNLIHTIRLINKIFKLDKISVYSTDNSLNFYKKQGFEYNLNNNRKKEYNKTSKYMTFKQGGKRKKYGTRKIKKNILFQHFSLRL
jgi:hypothetical protein